MPRPRSVKYGSEHKRLRRAWAARVAAGGVLCARCGEPIDPAAKWDLGHDDLDPTGTTYSGPEHEGCNRRTNGRRAGPRRHSQVW